jgi:A/G-specific adenine glycosylase
MEIETLIQWFNEVKRDFPWRKQTTPYGVWVSEVMLQQTQASVVVPYYLRFMERFPTVASLAEAPLAEVIKLWEGLGYYSRARNLHRGAIYVMKEYGGVLPSAESALLKIPGLGPYTVGAVRAFAFHQKAAAVDGNVIRVVSRLFAIEEDVCKTSTKKKILECTERLLPQNRPWIVTEALIELGATVCKKTPLCLECPMKSSCRAHAKGIEDRLPIKSDRVQVTPLNRLVALIQHRESFLMRQVPAGLLMEGLYEFPYFEEGDWDHAHEAFFEAPMQLIRKMKPVIHSFTRYRATLNPVHWVVRDKKEVDGFVWKTLEEAKELPFSAGHRKILRALIS